MGRGSCFSFFCPCGANVGCGLFPRRCLGLTCFGLPGRVYPNRQYSPPFFCPFWANVGCGLFPRRCLGLTCFGLPGRVYPNRQYSPPFFCPFWANVGCGLFSCRVYFSKEARSCGVFNQPPTLYKQESPKLLISLELNNSTFVSSCESISLRRQGVVEFFSCGVFYHPPVQADMLSACMEYEDILSDKQRGAHLHPLPNGVVRSLPQPSQRRRKASYYLYERF